MTDLSKLARRITSVFGRVLVGPMRSHMKSIGYGELTGSFLTALVLQVIVALIVFIFW